MPSLQHDSLNRPEHVFFPLQLIAAPLGVFGVATQLFLGGSSFRTALFIAMMYSLFLTLVTLTARPKTWLIFASRTSAALCVLGALTLVSCLISSSQFNLATTHDLRYFFNGLNLSDRSRGLIELIKLMGIGAALMCGAVACISATQRYQFLTWTIVSILLYSTWALLTQFLFPQTVMGFGHKSMFEGRLTASFVSANSAGTFFGMSFILSLTQVLSTDFEQYSNYSFSASWERILEKLFIPALSTITSGICLLLTLSRAALISTGICAAALASSYLLRSRRVTAPLIAVLIGALSGLVFVSISIETMIMRMQFISTDFLSRQQIVQSHWPVIRSAIISGHGLGSFAQENRHILTIRNYDNLWSLNSMHNEYMGMIESSGVIGSILSAGIAILVLAYITVGRTNFMKESWITAILGSSFLIAIHSFADFSLENYAIACWWALLLGSAVGIARSNAEGNRKSQLDLDQPTISCYS